MAGTRLIPRSIRAQLGALVLAAMLPLMGLLAWVFHAGAERDAQRARQQVFHLAQVTAADAARFIAQGRNILNGLAARPAVLALDAARCDPILKEFLTLAPRFANALTLSAEGRLLCSGVPLATGSLDRVDPAFYLRRALETGEFTIGTPAKGFITGRWVVTLAQPLRDAQGRAAGAVALSIDLMKMPVLPSLEGLSPRAVVGIVAADGTVVARSLEPERFVGTNGRDQTRHLLAEKSGTAEEIGLDGILRIRGYAPIPGTDWIAVASLPSSVVFAGLRQRTAVSAVLVLTAMSAALLLALWLARRIREPVIALAEATNDVANGNLATRVPVAGAAEIATVARQFNRMLEARGRAEAAQREVERRYRDMLDEVDLVSVMLDLEGRIVYCNDFLLRLTGWRRGEVLGRDWFALFVPSDQGDVKATFLQMLKGDALARHFENEILGKSGTRRLIHWNNSILRSAEGAIVGTASIGEDISERRHAEQALRDSEKRIRNLFDQAADGIFHLTPDHRYLDANAQGLRMLGYSRDELLQLRLTDVLAENERHRLDDEVPAMMAGTPHLAEWLHLRKDGTTFPAEVSARVLSDVDYLAIVRDLTERREAERAVSESMQRLRRILDNMFPFVGLLSLDGRVLEVNRAPLEAGGLKREDVIGRDCAEIAWFSHSIEAKARLRVALARTAAGETVRYDETIHVLGGRMMAIDLMFSPLRDAAGRIVEIVGSATDITERKAAERERQAYAEESRSLSRRIMEIAETERRAISRELHDRIGQNLATLNLNLKLIRGQIATQAPVDTLARIDDAHGMIEGTARHARDLMAELDPPALEDFGLLAALRVYTDSFASRVEMRVAVLGTECEPRLPPRIELALFRIVQEALANVAKHAQAASVEVALTASPGRVTLAVADNGKGFDAASAARRPPSWGLTIMRERAAAAGADLHIESAPGRGTRVEVELAWDAA